MDQSELPLIIGSVNYPFLLDQSKFTLFIQSSRIRLFNGSVTALLTDPFKRVDFAQGQKVILWFLKLIIRIDYNDHMDTFHFRRTNMNIHTTASKYRQARLTPRLVKNSDQKHFS